MDESLKAQMKKLFLVSHFLVIAALIPLIILSMSDVIVFTLTNQTILQFIGYPCEHASPLPSCQQITLFVPKATALLVGIFVLAEMFREGRPFHRRPPWFE